ncbi:MerR family transcriptional regulator [Clostridium gasigenes]|uniref:MerR family transcriptional regulator n=1 Tax=Clostridium gasigenes TaxID=94869 RepID=A0A7X0VT45_9CLOT|nr:MerR family transcriptional regulator [Clostridium gasigenes]MBB6716400.1 MerR family transcriptional regulator [Clostridium gasigenes]MBU3109638.1 MerR family transcriptional regulator [Clostridium gasigenes]MBU3134234.1 MerR family transcriptional regulator [Clostridium gasigenes]MBU3137859.1 MerR family transcriptional regulator [Clostridium gasigenes]NKF08265.1 MerR family transcriptional regulator [Clostridium gasigenes]
MKSYKIGELANILKIKIDTIRYYEKIGLIPEPKRLENEYRVYSEKYVEIIQFIILCKNNGFTLKEISKIINLLSLGDANNKELKTIVSDKIDTIDIKIKELNFLKKQLNEVVKNCDSMDCTTMNFL